MKKKILITLLVIVVAFVLLIKFVAMPKLVAWSEAQNNNEDPTFWSEDVSGLNDTYASSGDVDIVLTGSSSPRKWETYSQDFSEYSIVNTGFGGCKVGDVTYYYDDVVAKYTPEVVIFWAGTNDIHGTTDNSKTGAETFAKFVEFYETAQASDPEVKIVFIPINPTKQRESVWSDANAYNQLVAEMATTEDNLYYVDVTEALMSGDTYDEQYLSFDGLHLNEEGYAVINEYTQPVVEDAMAA